jgi:sec-independent protein translocase protein TatC
MNTSDMSFWDHVSELRRRLLICAIALVLATIGSFFIAEPAARYIMQPVGDMTFVFLSPPELFMAYVRIALMIAIVVTSPLILFQTWLFVRPGLEKHERGALLFGLIFGAFFFAGGVLFAFFIVVPLSLNFFLQYQNDSITAMFSFAEYIGFVKSMLIAFGVAFELPVVSSILSALGIVKGTSLAKARRYAILLIFVGSAIITPPDIVSQVILALPMMALFELSIVLAKRNQNRRAKREAAAALAEA